MKNLDKKFEEAYKIASNINEKLPPDVMLQLYAYYKQATVGDLPKMNLDNSENLRNAFKLNAWFQIRNMSSTQAKKQYVRLVEKIIDKKI
ncbi:MAG: phosphatidylserine decarboxylase [Flavobacteriales bacterium]|nr:MAG: phosphatidylserine decarboxylase [Flavobacteriales bacterium]PIE49060.1 MAG: phosphatidylserine decarboxylase [Flavobacteriales bacterium]